MPGCAAEPDEGSIVPSEPPTDPPDETPPWELDLTELMDHFIAVTRRPLEDVPDPVDRRAVMLLLELTNLQLATLKFLRDRFGGG